MEKKLTRKNYDDLGAELSLMERVREIRAKALRHKSPDIRKMICVYDESHRAWYYVADESRLMKLLDKLRKQRIKSCLVKFPGKNKAKYFDL